MVLYPKSWGDMSNYVVHFTKGSGDNDDYLTMMHIYDSQRLEPKRAFGIGIRKAPPSAEQKAVCFSEIPPGQWKRLVDRRETRYGIAFTKEFIISRGGGPIWYAWKDTPHWKRLQELMDSAIGDAAAPIWRLTPMIDAPGYYGDKKYLFDWEREWRHVGQLAFTPKDVAFLMIPEELHDAAHGFFETAYHEHLGPAYFCPYVDPSWDGTRILKALSP